MARKTHTVISLRAGPLAPEDLSVLRVTGHEALSQPFSFEIDFRRVDGEPIALPTLGGAESALSLRRTDGPERHVHGLLWSVEMLEVVDGEPRYRAVLVPRLLRLRHVRRSRVFQRLSVPEVVKRVLGEGGIAHKLSLSAAHPPREHCVQYRESDLAFVSRLLEDEGIFYRFEHTESAHTLILADGPSGCAQLSDPATFRFPRSHGEESTEAPDDEHVFHLAERRRAQAAKVALKDFDFKRPALAVEGTSSASGDPLALEHYEYPGGFDDPRAGTALSKTRLEELRFGAETFQGDSSVLGFNPGSVVELAEHPVPAFNRKLLLVRVEHAATQEDRADAPDGSDRGYANTFLALDAAVPYRPQRRTPWPSAHAETAVVVGPAGEEIHPDAHDSVKVQFHWDREGKKNDTSSCFLRVAQVWAGGGWGGSFLPRIGQEVLVRFLDGDPDRPLVIGAIYNGANAPPIALPGEKTRSTLRSDSSPGSGGSNELRLEDAKGDEQIYRHAQKDESVRVLHDKAQRIGANETLTVKNDRARRIEGNQDLHVHKHDASTVDKNQKRDVKGDRDTTVDGSHTELVGAQQTITIAALQKIKTGKGSEFEAGLAASLTVGGVLAVKAKKDDSIAVSGSLTRTVGGSATEKIKKERSATLSKSASLKVAAGDKIDVKGSAAFGVGKDGSDDVSGKSAMKVKAGYGAAMKSFKLEADKLVIEVGSAKLTIKSSGDVSFAGGAMTLDGSKLTLKGSEIKKSG